MRLGLNHNFFSIAKVESQSPRPQYRVEAATSAADFQFAALHQRVVLEVPDTTLAELAEFESLKSNLLEIRLSEGGWLRFKRNIRGTIVFRYRLCRWNMGAVLEGEVIVESDGAAALCRELRSLLTDIPA